MVQEVGAIARPENAGLIRCWSLHGKGDRAASLPASCPVAAHAQGGDLSRQQAGHSVV